MGLGLAQIGELQMDAAPSVSRLLNVALDEGINFFDTAACYKISEELLGKSIAHRRHEFVLASKCGHSDNPNSSDWNATTITTNIERSLKRLRTDHLDLLQLHSCGVDVLERGEAIETLETAKKAGKVRFIGYSGDNEAAQWALHSGLFDVLQTSFNLVDQRARYYLLQKAKELGVGLIIKRPLGNVVWGASKSPDLYYQSYFQRAVDMRNMGPLAIESYDPVSLALGFVFSHAEIDTAIIGTQNEAHLRANLAWMRSESHLPAEIIEELYFRFDKVVKNKDQLT